MAQLAAITKHGERLRQPQRLSAKPPHPGNDRPRDPLQAPRQQLARTERGQRPAVPPGRPQQLGQVQRVTAAGRVHRRAQLITGRAAGRGAHHRAHRFLAQQRRAQHRRRLRAHRQQRSPHHRQIALTQRHQQPRRQPLQPRRQVGQPAQRRLISPVRIIDGDQQRPASRQVSHQPVQAMQHRERAVTSRLRGELAGQQRPRRGSRPSQQRLTLTRPRPRQAPFEQLAHHAKRETRLQLRPRARTTW